MLTWLYNKPEIDMVERWLELISLFVSQVYLLSQVFQGKKHTEKNGA